ncbi:uncharacterized protein LOC134776319 [Penaeus indicus]|uniref:uncharacterized protein LOC134776319 n=1 Tax=Penaeus indicus TaxID=29960 RepID=UPI00300D4148
MTLSPGPRAQPAHHPHQQPQHATPTPTRRVLPDIISVVRAGQQGAIISRPATPQRHLPLPPPRQEQPPPTPPSARNGVASPAALSPLPPSSRKAPPAEEELLKPPLGWETPLGEESGEGWGEDGRVGGGGPGEEEHRFCCTVARMRLVIHLQTMLREQFEALQDELERRREECIQLRTVLANRAHDLRSLTQSSYGKDVDIVNEDGELAIAYQTQKQVNRQLEEELKSEKLRHREAETEYKSELDRLRRDNDRQQKLLAQNLTKGGGSQPETLLQSEIMRLTSENLNLQGQVDNLTEQLKKYKRSLKAYAKKIKESGGKYLNKGQRRGRGGCWVHFFLDIFL